MNTGRWLLGSCKCLQEAHPPVECSRSISPRPRGSQTGPLAGPAQGLQCPPVSGFAFSPSRKSGGSLQGCLWEPVAPAVSRAFGAHCPGGQLCRAGAPAVQQGEGGGRGRGVGGGRAAAATHAGPALVCFLNLGFLVGGGEPFPFSARNVTRPLIPTWRCLIISIQSAASARQLLLCRPHLCRLLYEQPHHPISQPGQWPRAHG